MLAWGIYRSFENEHYWPPYKSSDKLQQRNTRVGQGSAAGNRCNRPFEVINMDDPGKNLDTPDEIFWNN